MEEVRDGDDLKDADSEIAMCPVICGITASWEIAIKQSCPKSPVALGNGPSL